nr:flagellar protein FlaG [uncultured Desulfobacter sp.]
MNMTAKSLTAQESVQERTPLISVDKLQSVQKNVENTEAKENKVSSSQKDKQQMSTEEVKEVVESFQEMSETIQTKLSFSVDEENNEIVVKIFDKESEELIRQFPSDEMLSLQDKMSDLAGFLFDQKV